MSSQFSTKQPELKFKSKVWLYSGKGGWHFASIPNDISLKVKELRGPIPSRFGAVSVIATIGDTTWDTSIFWDKKSNSFLLPLKAEVRKKEKIEKEEVIEIGLKIVL